MMKGPDVSYNYYVPSEYHERGCDTNGINGYKTLIPFTFLAEIFRL
jgi:hypothetical protein